MIREKRNHRCHVDADRNPRLREPLDGKQSPCWRGGAWLKVARNLMIQRGHGNTHVDEVSLSHALQNIDIAFDQSRLRNEPHRLIERRHDFQALPRQFVFAFTGLERIRNNPQADDVRLIRWP